jgi:hypothetical protein
LIVEWLKIAYLHGYLDGQRRIAFRGGWRRRDLRSP